MTRVRLLLLLLAVVLLGPAWAAGATRPELRSAEADRELLLSIVDQEQIDARRPRPQLAHYVEDVSEAAIDRLHSLLGMIAPGLLSAVRSG